MNGYAAINHIHEYDDDFHVEILQDLIAQGYNGNELIVKFVEHRAKIRNAIKRLISEADDIAAGTRKGATTKDIFGED